MSYVQMPEAENKSARTLTMIIYALYASTLLCLFFAPFIAIVLNYVKKDDMVGTMYESHFRWQIRTFWYSLLWSVIGGLLALIIIGWAVLFAVFIWFTYRIVKGWLRLYENKPMYMDAPVVTRMYGGDENF
ncbi:MAG: hypothetical protein LBS40_06365 [Burkholderiales bacterium]|jgi:uncharacterized membrane protein|nr:hypothetical protein [Burkholderiales bacterium]